MSESFVGTFNSDTPAPSASARTRLAGQRAELQARFDEMAVRGDEMTGPGDAVDHAQSVSRQIEVEHIQSQLNQLDHLLSLPPRDDDEVPEGTIGIGSTVRLAFPGGDEETMLLASVEEATDAGDVLTFDSPLGSALIGKQVGDDVEYTAPAGSMKVRVVAIDSTSTN